MKSKIGCIAMSDYTRKVIQISTSVSVAEDINGGSQQESIIALCDDGTMWEMNRGYDEDKRGYVSKWEQISNVPQIETTQDMPKDRHVEYETASPIDTLTVEDYICRNDLCGKHCIMVASSTGVCEECGKNLDKLPF